MDRGQDERRPLADRRPPEQADDSPTEVPEFADEDTPSETDPPEQWRSEDDEDHLGPPTRA